ncbi:hypothetical protein [Amycolatopsis sp. NPDC004079]|uniref:hypothetical protein n=1 Tax=Amycolatopsis sp. NPDC004079 TaxID=3154549 RepID=UPI0033A0DAD1
MDLNERMEFGHVIQVHEDSSITDADGMHAPEVYVTTDADGQILDADEREMTASVEAQGWELMTGYTGQYGYRGPTMHPSEYVGGGLEQDIFAEPGYYVACVVEVLDNAEGDPAGWVVARKDG